MTHNYVYDGRKTVVTLYKTQDVYMADHYYRFIYLI